VISLHVILFYPAFVMTYNEYENSDVYKNQFDFYSHPTFWFSTLLIVGTTVPVALFFKHGRQIFYPNLIDLVMSKRISKTLDIQKKLEIDIVELGKGLESDSDDESLNNRAPEEIPISKQVASLTRNNTAMASTEPFNHNQSSDNSRFECKSEIGQVEYEDNKSQKSSLRKSFSEISASSNSKNQSLKKSYSKSSESSVFRSMKRSNDSRSPAFEKGFSDNYEEVKKANLMNRYSSSAGFKKSSRKRTNNKTKSAGKKKNLSANKNDIKFYPHRSTVGGDTIQEKSDEEDIDESPPKARRHNESSNFEESKSFADDSHTSKVFKAREHTISFDTSNEDYNSLPHFNPTKSGGNNRLVTNGNDTTVLPTTLDHLAISEKDSEFSQKISDDEEV
jgi:hypothetical protein